MTGLEVFAEAFERCPLIAILRGVQPEEVEAIGEGLVEAGFTLIEVPLNSPNPLASIARLAQRLGSRAIVGAGTVLRAEDVAAVQAAGGALVIAPNTDVRVIRAAAGRDMAALPGFATPTEAFAALEAGAAGLKLFPAEAASPAVVKALRAVLPAGTRLLPVGGIVPEAMAAWVKAGASGFGLGSALYAPGSSAADVARRAERFVTVLRELRPSS